MRRRLIHRVKPRDFDLDRFQCRLTARLCVIFIAITQIGLRLLLVFAEPGLSQDSKISYLTSLPFLIVASLIVGIEFLLFKKIGPKITKYSFLVDLLLLGVFLGEWVSNLNASLVKIKLKQPPSFGVTALLGFTSFSWRTQIQPFIVQYWQLKIIPPVVAFGLVIGYSIVYDPEETVFTLCRGLLQVAYVIVLFYFEDKIQWKMMLANMQQERWVQINDFILNNIPENIAILDLDGHVKFTSDYLKAFMERCRCSQDLKEFFLKIKDLQQQADTDTSSSVSVSRIHMERIATSAAFLDKELDQKGSTAQAIDSLEELVLGFRTMIKEKYLRERSFLIYNGKLKTETRNIEKSIEIKISYIQQQNSEFIIVIIRDTTQRDLLVTLEDNNKYKDQLLASVSHELRAPLNGNISLLEATVHSKEVPDNIKEQRIIPALRSSKYLLHIINDILDMSQIKAQKLRLVFQPENIKKTLINTIQLIELQAQKKGVVVVLEMEQGIPKSFCTDHVRLSQIVLNLLNNALKFTFEGVIKLIARPIEGLPWLKIIVEDSGIGMSSNDMKKLFAGNFTHIDFQDRELINPAGVGLGLNIAYNLVELLGPKNHNEIQVKSIPNQGSTFSFIIENKEAGLACQNEEEDSLKVAKEERTEEEIDPKMKIQSYYLTKSMKKFYGVTTADDEEKEAKPCYCAKVLIVDDNPFNTLAFESILGPLEIKSDSIFDGKSAIEKILNRQRHLCGDDCKPYSVIFMDQEMPGMTGSEVVRELRKLQEENIIPIMKIIGCTAHGGKEEIERFLESGIDECIQKPISKQMIVRILKECGLR